MTDLEPVEYDGHGAPVYGYQLGDRLDDETRRRLLEAVDNDRA